MPELSEILSQFSSLGVDLSDEVAAVCLDLCSRYSLDEESFLNSWIAFSVSKIEGAEPSLKTLDEFERKELISVKTPKRTTSSNVQVFSSGRSKTVHSANDNRTPSKIGSSTPGVNSSRKLAFSPLVFTPDTFSPSEKFNSRKNSGQIVGSLGTSEYDWKSEPASCRIESYKKADSSKWKFLYDTLTESCEHLEDRMENLVKCIVETNKLEEPVPLKECGLEPKVFTGRVRPYDKTSISRQLIGIEIQGMYDSDYRIADVDLSDVENFSTFPGQIVAFEGISVGKKILVTKIYSSAVLPLAPTPTIRQHLEVMVAAGPFTVNDTLSYEPLNDLIELAKKSEPNVLILIGPLVDATHPKISQGQIAETFSDYYSRLVKRIEESLEATNIQVVVIASSKDAHNLPIYPTPPAATDTCKNIKFFPDPAVISIDGLVLGMTSVDTIFHLGKHELSNCMANRLGRLAAHTIQQQTFYPLYPPEAEACLDVPTWINEGQLTITPHVMILPSELNGFTKEANGCVLLNPGKMAKGLAGGTYALIEVRPVNSNEEWTTSSHISSKIVRI